MLDLGLGWAHSSGNFRLAKCAKDSKFLLGFLLANFPNDSMKDCFGRPCFASVYSAMNACQHCW